MIFVNTHPDLAGKHALLGASKHAWLNYSDEKLMDAYRNSFAAQIGTLLHEYAKDKIFYRQKMEDNQSEKNNVLLHLLKNDIPLDVINLDGLFYNLVSYVNDGVGYKMTPEVLLYYTDNAFGWADTVSFSRNTLRIHDLKTGAGPVTMDQLMIYAGFFFLQYKKEANVQKVKTELRIYQNNEVLVYTPEKEDIRSIMDKIVHADMVVNKN